MNGFVRQVAVLSVLWSMCELLLPDGRLKRLTRMTASVMVMISLVTALNGLLGVALPTPSAPAMAQAISADSYARAALASAQNQVRGYVERLAARAGYEACAEASFSDEGALMRVALWLAPARDKPLVSEGELVRRMAEALKESEALFSLEAGAP